MNKWKALAVLFMLISFGAIRETYRIFTSSDRDIAPNRPELIIMAILLTAVIIFFTIRFWKKASDKRIC